MRAIVWASAVLVAAAASGVVAQDLKRDKPLLSSTTDKKIQCENALLSKDYLKDCKVTCTLDSKGKILCEGTVPSKVHACAVFLTCMSVDGVDQCDVSRLRITGSRAGDSSPPPKTLEPGTDVKGGLAKEPTKDGALASKRLRLFAIVSDATDREATTTPAGAKRFQTDVIVVDDSGEPLVIPEKKVR